MKMQVKNTCVEISPGKTLRDVKSRNFLESHLEHEISGGVTIIHMPGDEIAGQNGKEDLYGSMRHFLMLGKFLGLIHAQGLFQGNWQNLTFRRTKRSVGIFFLIVGGLGLLALDGLLGVFINPVRNAADMMRLTVIIINITAAIIFTHSYLNCAKLLEIFQEWNNMELYFTRKDKQLGRDVLIITGIVMSSAIFENVTWHATYMYSKDWNEGATTGEKIAVVINGVYDQGNLGLIPRNILTALLACLTDKLGFFGWNYMDLCVIIFARAIYFKFKSLVEQAQALLLLHPEHICDPTLWRQLVKDHETLRSALEKINGFLSAPVFLTSAMSVYWIGFHILQGFREIEGESQGPVVVQVYKYWSLAHVISRAVLLNIMGANINHWAHQIGPILSKCPQEARVYEVKRAERFVTGNTIGLTGLGYFTITRPLNLQIVGVIFTLEVVLLQALQSH